MNSNSLLNEVIISIASEEDIPVIRIDKDIIQLGYGKHSKLISDGVINDNTSPVALNIISNKSLLKKILLKFGLPVASDLNLIGTGIEYNFLVLNDDLITVNKCYQTKNNISNQKVSVNKVNDSIKEIVIKAVRMIDLNIAEVKLKSFNISAPLAEGEGIIDIIAIPDFRRYHSLDSEIIKNISQKILEELTPKAIPIISIIDQCDITAKIIAKILEESGVGIGLEDMPNQNLGESSILKDKKIETAIFNIEKREIQSKKFMVNWNNILVISDLSNIISNIGEIKIFELLKKDGCLILDIDKLEASSLIRESKIKRSIYCSFSKDNILIQRQIKRCQEAVYINDGNIILFDGVDELPIIAIYRLIKNKEGLKSILLAIAVAYVYGVPAYIIRSILTKIKKISQNISYIFKS
ncbi:hypothetical protein [Orenia marismortui]|uniref:Uncharacterized protein n=1 Tax=Orenia marismortui TaxID=46469 RepID=A0A4R8H0D0_9FIRM|nr:hypothetical protein [Orenia marismortui]TDX51273.1 hypothetical protein C7959_11421 [Orenia marismortui]